MLSSVGKNALLLGTAAVLCVFAVAAVNEITKAISDRELKTWLIWGLGALYLLLIIRYVVKKLIKR